MQSARWFMIVVAVSGAATLLPGCGGGGGGTPSLPGASQGAMLTLSAQSLSFTSLAAQSFDAVDSSYHGTFSVSSCGNVLTISAASASGPKATFKVTPLAAGACSLVVSEDNGRKATLPATVTLTQGTIQ